MPGMSTTFITSPLVGSVCNRYVEYLGNASELFGRLFHYRTIELSVRLAPIDQVVQQLAAQCSQPGHLRNLLWAVARIYSLSDACTWSLLRSVLSGCQGREEAVADALLQLAKDQEPPPEEQGPDKPQALSAPSAFAVLAVELLRLTDEPGDDSLAFRHCHTTTTATAAGDRDGAVDHDKVSVGPLGGSPGAAERVLEKLEEAARAQNPDTLSLMARAVSERLYPLDPGLACSWALRQVRDCCCGSGGRPGGSSAAATSADAAAGAVQRPPQPVWPAAAASSAAPYLVAVLGLPLTLRTVEDELGRGTREAGALWGERAGGGHGVGAGTGATGTAADDARRPLAALLAAVATLGDEGEEAVWVMLNRVLTAALGGGGGGGGGGGARGRPAGPEAPLHQHQQQQQQLAVDVRQAAAVLAVAEGVIMAGEAEGPIGGSVGAEVPGGGGGATAGGATAAGASRLEALLLRPLLLPGTSPDGVGGSGAAAAQQQRRVDGAAAVHAVQMYIERAVSQSALGVYERVLQSASGAAPPGGVGPQQQQQQQQQHRRLLQTALAQVRNRAQYLAQTGGGQAWGPSAAAAAAAGGHRGGAAAAAASGDPVFAMQCLAEFTQSARNPKSARAHMEKMSGQFYRAKWVQGVKPVLLRPTLDEDAARRRHSYLKEAASFRLISINDLDRWEQLHEQLGLSLEGPPRGGGGGGGGGGPAQGGGSGGSSGGGGGGGEAAPRSPVDDLLRRLASVGPSLTAGSTLDAVMVALEAALADELAPPPQPGAQNVGPEAGAAAEAVAAHLAELVLEAFVAAEELEAAAAAAAVPHMETAGSGGAAAAAAAANAAARPALRRRQSHLVWQLRLLDVVSRWPQLHAPLCRRLLQLTTDPRVSASLDEAQVLGVAAALAAMSCVGVSRDAAATSNRGPGAAGAAARARYKWQLPRCPSGWWSPQGRRRQPPAAAAAVEGTRSVHVPGPALAAAALRALPLGPSPPQLRFSATFLAAYLRQCGLLESWVLYDEVDDADGGGGDGGLGIGTRYAPPLAVGSAAGGGWPAPVPVWVSPLVDGADRRRRQQQHQGGGDAGGCVTCVALRTFVWIQKFGEVVVGEAAGRDAGACGGGGSVGWGDKYNDGDDGDGHGGCWRDVVEVCNAFGSSALGAAMLESGTVASRAVECARSGGGGGDGGGGDSGGGGARGSAAVVWGSKGADAGAGAAWWDEAAMLRLTLRALEQGLPLPRQLMAGQAALLLRHMAPPPPPSPGATGGQRARAEKRRAEGR